MDVFTIVNCFIRNDSSRQQYLLYKPSIIQNPALSVKSLASSASPPPESSPPLCLSCRSHHHHCDCPAVVTTTTVTVLPLLPVYIPPAFRPLCLPEHGISNVHNHLGVCCARFVSTARSVRTAQHGTFCQHGTARHVLSPPHVAAMPHVLSPRTG